MTSNNNSIHLDDLNKLGQRPGTFNQESREESHRTKPLKEWKESDLYTPRSTIKKRKRPRKQQTQDYVQLPALKSAAAPSNKTLNVSKSFKNKMDCYGLQKYMKVSRKGNNHAEAEYRKKSPPSSSSSFGKTRLAELEIKRKISSSIKEVKQGLPIEFLRQYGNESDATDVAVQTIYKILHRFNARRKFYAITKWKTVVNEFRIQDRAEEVLRISHLGILTAAFHRLRQNHHVVLRSYIFVWTTDTRRKRLIEHNEMARIIQYSYKCSVARSILQCLKVAARHLLETTAAVTIQRHVRGVAGRSRMRRLQRALLEHDAVCVITRAAIVFFIRLGLYNARRHRSCIKIQSIIRKFLAKKAATRLKSAYAEIARTIYKSLLLNALKRGTKWHYNALIIQRSFRFYQTRKTIKLFRALWYRKRRYFPARTIQNAWIAYRNQVITSVMRFSLIEKVVEEFSAVAEIIQKPYRQYILRKKTASSDIIKNLLRASQGRRVRHELQSSVINDLVTELRRRKVRVPTFTEQRHFRSLSALRTETKFIMTLRNETNIHTFNSACVIQARCRGVLARSYAPQLCSSKHLLENLVPVLVRAFLIRQRRKRVLRRWRRNRRRILVPVFQNWEKYASALVKLRKIREAKRRWHIAEFHHKRHVIRPTWNSLIIHRNKRRVKHQRWRSAELHHAATKLQKWYTNVENFVVDDSVWRMKNRVILFNDWKVVAKGIQNERAAMVVLRFRIYSNRMRQWKKFYMNELAKRRLATLFYNRMILKPSVFKSFRNYVATVRKADEMARERAKRRMLLSFSTHAANRKSYKALCAVAASHWENLLRKRTIQSFRKALMLRNQKNALMQSCDEHYYYVTTKKSVLIWEIYAHLQCHLSDMMEVGMRKRRKKYLMEGYIGFFQHWSSTAGERKIKAALRIQTRWRTVVATRYVAGVRALFHYQFETRIKAESDVKTLCANDLWSLSQRTHQWMVVMFYMPWNMPSKGLRTEFATAATTLRKLRKQLQFAYVDAFEPDSVTGQNISVTYNLTTDEPRIFLFWQSRNLLQDPTMKNPSHPKYKLVVRPFAEEIPTTSQALIEWFTTARNRSRSITAIQLQAFIRGCLCRKELERQRVALLNATASHLQQWYVYRRQVQVVGRTNRAAFKIQQWYKQRKRTIQFKADVTFHMAILRAPILTMQRALRSFFSRRLFTTFVEEKYATPSKYPKALLCIECESDALAFVKCMNCEEPYCDKCFAVFHNVGERATHRVCTIDFKAMHENSLMCPECNVQKVKRSCVDCHKSYCITCFESAHTRRAGVIRHQWTPYSADVSSFDGTLGIPAQDIIRQHEDWKTLEIVQEEARVEAIAKHKKEEEARQLEEIIQQNKIMIREAFDLYDLDQSGFIDRDELEKMMIEELCEPITSEELDEAMVEMDSDGNNEIQFQEFLVWMSRGIMAGTKGKSTKLRKQLQAKKKLRKRQEERDAKAAAEAEAAPVPTVPGHGTVPLITLEDFAAKRSVFVRYVASTYKMDWMYDDERYMDSEKMKETFAKIFLKRWNSGKLGHEFYYDKLAFDFKSCRYECLWDRKIQRYVYKNHTTGETESADPRKLESLRQDATEAFEIADTDGSGDIDENEFYYLIVNILCEPLSRKQVRVFLNEIDTDGGGTIDFDEFFTWYAAEQSQNYGFSAKLEAAKKVLRAQRGTKVGLKKAANAGIKQGKALQATLDKKMAQARLELDSKGASPELLDLLHRGYSKAHSTLALKKNDNDLEKAVQWLVENIEQLKAEDQYVKDEKKRVLEERTKHLRMATKATVQGLSVVQNAFKSKVKVEPRMTQAENVGALMASLEYDLQQAAENED